MSILRTIIDAIFRVLRGPMSEAELATSLDDLAGKSSERLDWRNSIVDLMKLVNMDSSLEARKGLAQELGYTGALNGSAEMNIWLHGRVMQEVARSGH